MRQGVNFASLTKALAYFKHLGVSHLYLSPIFKASRASPHGYDVADPNQICSSLGGYHGFIAFANEAKAKGLGIILDIVPNHMVADSKANSWWHDVLESGPYSPYAQFFDLRHEQRSTGFPAQYILPVLNHRFQQILTKRELRLTLTKKGFYFSYKHYLFPINLLGIEQLLKRAIGANSKANHSSELDSAFRFVANFNQDFYDVLTSDQGHLYKKISGEFKDIHLSKILSNYDWQSVFRVIYDDQSFLRELMRLQFYQLVYWRHANRFLNYRRFFNINDLVAMRVEDPSVFAKTHSLVIELCKYGYVDGLRIDHIDGLRYPYEYLTALRKILPKHYLFVEKILHVDESLLSDWPIDGSTGYDFLAMSDQIFVDADSKETMEHAYFHFIGETIDQKKLSSTIKNHVINSEFKSDFNAIVKLFISVLTQYGEQFDYTEAEVSHFLLIVFINMDVYRTYSDGGWSSYRHFLLHWKQNLYRVYEDITADYHLLYQRFSSMILSRDKSAKERIFVERAQLLLPPLAAKGIEDTLFYRYYRLAGLNEVGGYPEIFGQSLQSFYHFLSKRQKQFKLTLSATSTHDTKTSEDVRSRLIALSQAPKVWLEFLSAYEEINSAIQRQSKIDRNTCYGLLQYLLGSYPIDVERFSAFATKIVREAGVYSNWIAPNTSYELEILRFVEWVFESDEIRKIVVNACHQIDARSLYISIARVLLKHTAPGNPDIYQGNEILNYKLVDPDNRNPVCFDFLHGILKDTLSKDIASLVLNDDRSQLKIYLHHLCLRCRGEYFDLFKHGRFKVCDLRGDKKSELISYMRGDDVLVFMPRFYELGLRENYHGGFIDIPRPKRSSVWYDVINGISIKPGRWQLKDLWPILPFSLCIYRPLEQIKGVVDGKAF